MLHIVYMRLLQHLERTFTMPDVVRRRNHLPVLTTLTKPTRETPGVWNVAGIP